MTNTCCWLNQANLDEDCKEPASFEAWTLGPDGRALFEADTYACAGHLVDLLPAGADYRVRRLRPPDELPLSSAEAT